MAAMRAPALEMGDLRADRAPFVLLETADVEQLDAAAGRILSTVGVAVPSADARDALGAAGAHVDGQRVIFPAGSLRPLLERAPARIDLGARSGSALRTGEAPLLTTDGCCPEIHDLETGERRPTSLADVGVVARLADAIDAVDFCWPSVSAQDVAAERRGLVELHQTLANTGKHVQTVTITEPDQASVAVAMARAVAGGADECRRRPPVSALLGTVTPLGNDGPTIDSALIFAEAGVPVGFVTMPMGGSTTPLTMAGSLAVGLAEALCAVAAVQAATPGAPVFICFIPTFMDLRTGDFTGGAPEDTLMGAAVADIGRFYGLPTQCGVNSAGAKGPGWQSAVDDVATTFFSLLAGVDMLTGVGMVDGGRAFSYEEMVLGTEVAAAARALRGQGPGAALPDGIDPVSWAHRRAVELLASHRVTPLPDDTEAELGRLLESDRV
jgi:trimethylamine--corrinoid protein Co-methyltransferase